MTAKHWPFTVRAAYFGLSVEVVFGLLGMVLLFPVLFVAEAAEGAAVVAAAAVLGLVMWISARFPRRERRVRWGAVAACRRTLVRPISRHMS